MVPKGIQEVSGNCISVLTTWNGCEHLEPRLSHLGMNCLNGQAGDLSRAPKEGGQRVVGGEM